MSSRPDCIFEIHQLWKSDFTRVYSSSCSSEPVWLCVRLYIYVYVFLYMFYGIQHQQMDQIVIDQRTRKLMTIHRALHSKDGVDRRYVPRKQGGRGLTSIQESVNTSIQYIRKHWRRLITATSIDRTKISRKQEYEE